MSNEFESSDEESKDFETHEDMMEPPIMPPLP